jgi:5-methylcytosine-specific restriction endonuclease McrA
MVERMKLNRPRLPKLRATRVDQSIYNDKRWRRIRRDLARSRTVCEECGSDLATECHHVIPVLERPDLAFEPSNVRRLCRRCHKAIHRKH